MSATAPSATIAERLADVQGRIDAACDRAGRDPASVTLVAVSKTRPVEDLLEAVAAGATHFGENYVQEGVPKVEALRAIATAPFIAHFIGALQRNKVRAALSAFGIIHSVDSARLLEMIAAQATAPAGVFLQVNLAGEESKGGATPGGLAAPVQEARAAGPNIDLLGLMTVPPASDAETARPWFRQLRNLAEQHGLHGLSMGMTGDFEAAIDEGATHIRVGTAIFGARA
jgi:pyridoxal phosphate enzyme (YggS family)